MVTELALKMKYWGVEGIKQIHLYGTGGGKI
jgi:hypothetical protein